MELSLLLAEKIASLAFIMLCGFVIVRLGLLKGEDSRYLSIINVYIIIPSVIINAFQSSFTEDKLSGLGVTVIAAFIVHAIFILLNWALKKPLKLQPVEQASLMFPNAGNLTIPLVASTLGGDMVIYALSFLGLQTIFFWSYGRILLSGNKAVSLRKIFGNINIICCAIGLTLFLLQYKLPAVIGGAVSSMAELLGPFSMIIIGMLLGATKLKTVFGQKRVWLLSLMRLVFYPIVMIGIFLILRATGLIYEKGVLIVTLLAAAGPTAVNIVSACQTYGGDAGYASSINVGNDVTMHRDNTIDSDSISNHLSCML